MEGIEKAPKLYHYTSQTGLLGMLAKKRLWFTHFNYLNDTEEFYYSLEQIGKVIKEEYGELLLKDLLEIFPKKDKVFPLFIFSLTERGDSLSQWRGYCPNGGYCVSFPKNYLVKLSEAYPKENDENPHPQLFGKRDLLIDKCCYEWPLQREFIKNKILGNLIDDYIKDKAENKRTNQLKKGVIPFPLLENIYKYAPFIKHEKFEDEHEWRIVAKYFYFTVPSDPAQPFSYYPKIHANYLEYLKFREGKSGIIPYLEFKSKDVDNIDGFINKLFIGPTPNKELAKQACIMLIKDEHFPVSNSEIPYKNW